MLPDKPPYSCRICRRKHYWDFGSKSLIWEDEDYLKKEREATRGSEPSCY